MSTSAFTILGIAGSLRRASYNRTLLRAAQGLAPEGVVIESYERLGEIPHYNENVRSLGEPEPVQDFKSRIAGADALLIATPEYIHGVPGVLKNALDWASRPVNDNPLQRKPVAIMGAATGNFGTVRAQLSLRQILDSTESHVLLKPEVLVYQAAKAFDETGNLVDEMARGLVVQMLTNLVTWSRRLASE